MDQAVGVLEPGRAENAHPGSLLADVEVAEEDRGKTRGLATDEGDQCSHLPAVPPARAGQVHVPDVERAGRCREAHAEGDAILERQVRPRQMMHAVCDDGERRQDGAALFEIERRRDGAVDARAQVRGNVPRDGWRDDERVRRRKAHLVAEPPGQPCRDGTRRRGDQRLLYGDDVRPQPRKLVGEQGESGRGTCPVLAKPGQEPAVQQVDREESHRSNRGGAHA